MNAASTRRASLGHILFRGVAASYLQATVGALVTLVAVPIYLRLLGQELYGLYLVAFSWVTYLQLARFGFPQVTQNQVAEAHATGNLDAAAALLRTAVRLTAAMAAAAGVVAAGLAASGVISPGLFQGSEASQRLALPVLAVAAAGYLLALPLEQFSAVLRGLQRVHLEQLVTAGVRLLALGGGIAVLLAGWGVVGLAASQAAAPLLIGGASLVLVLRILPRPVRARARASLGLARALFQPGMHFLLLSLAGALTWSLDNIVISGFVGTAAVTPYAVSGRLLTLFLTWLALGLGAVRPTVTALWSTRQRDRLLVLVLRMWRVAAGAAVLLGIEFAFFGRGFIELWAGPEAVLGRGPFLVLVAAMAVRALTLGSEVLLLAASRHERYAYLAVFQGLLNLGLSVALVQRLGVLGVALGTLLSYACCTGWFVPWSVGRLLDLRASRVLRTVFVPLVLPCTGGLLAAAASSAFLGGQGWLPWLAGTGATAGAFLGLGASALDREERAVLARGAASLTRRLRPGA